MKVKTWFKALRVPFFTGTVIPALFGTAFAFYREHVFDGFKFVLVIVGTVLVNAGLNLANDYFDFMSGNDNFFDPTPVSGGSRMIQQGFVSPTSILRASIACFSGAAAIGLYLNFVSKDNFILIIGLIGIILAYFYSAPPLKIGYRTGMAELVCGLGCGPLIICGSYYVQTQNFSWIVFLASLPIGILIGLVLFANEFPDHKADERVHKNTLVVRFGPQNAAYILVSFVAISYLVTTTLVLLEILPKLALFTLITVPLGYFIVTRILQYHSDVSKLIPANFAMIRLHLIFSLILIVTVLI